MKTDNFMKNQLKLGGNGFILDVIITKEKIDEKTFFVAQGIQLDVASQGLTLEEALENIRDAAEIVLEDSDEKRIMIKEEENDMAPMLTRVYV